MNKCYGLLKVSIISKFFHKQISFYFYLIKKWANPTKIFITFPNHFLFLFYGNFSSFPKNYMGSFCWKSFSLMRPETDEFWVIRFLLMFQVLELGLSNKLLQLIIYTYNYFDLENLVNLKTVCGIILAKISYHIKCDIFRCLHQQKKAP